MNERIRELRCKAQEAAAEAFPGKVPFDPNPDPILWDRIHLSYELFTQLIVQECAGIYSKIDNGNQHMNTDDYLEALQKHFGVE